MRGIHPPTRCRSASPGRTGSPSPTSWTGSRLPRRAARLLDGDAWGSTSSSGSTARSSAPGHLGGAFRPSRTVTPAPGSAVTFRAVGSARRCGPPSSSSPSAASAPSPRRAGGSRATVPPPASRRSSATTRRASARSAPAESLSPTTISGSSERTGSRRSRSRSAASEPALPLFGAAQPSERSAAPSD